MENRYDNKLREGNKQILSMCPAQSVLRNILAIEIKRNSDENSKIIEIGSGEGDSALPILKNNPTIKIELLDVSKEMINTSKEVLKDYLSQINFIGEDAGEYLKDKEHQYDIITSSWTLHNFNWEEKKELLNIIYKSLKEGGKFMMMDKVYPDDKTLHKFLLEHQNERYKYIDEEIGKTVVEHEHKDYLEEYRMDETNFLEELKKIGFKKSKIADRIERDIVLVATK